MPAPAQQYGPQYPPAPPRGTARPGWGAVPVAVGLLLVVLGLFALDWASKTSFADVHDVVDQHKSGFDVVTQVYVLYAVYPLFALVVASAVCAALGPLGARFGVGGLAVLGGASLVGLFAFVESGHVGTSDSRDDARPLLIAIVVGGVLVLLLGAVALFEKAGIVGRASVALLAAGVFAFHAAVLADLFDGPPEAKPGAWLPLVGYGLVLLGMVIPYRAPRAPAQLWGYPSPPQG